MQETAQFSILVLAIFHIVSIGVENGFDNSASNTQEVQTETKVLSIFPISTFKYFFGSVRIIY